MKLPKNKTTVFIDPGSKFTRNDLSVQNSNVFQMNRKEKKDLKRKRQEELVADQQLQKRRRKEARIPDALRPENNTLIRNKTEDEKYIDQLYFEMKDMVAKETMKKEDYDQFMALELEAQGKSLAKREKVQRNYRDLTQEKIKAKVERVQRIREELAIGTITKEELLREKKLKARQFKEKKKQFYQRMGAPMDAGIGKSKKDGTIYISQREQHSLTKTSDDNRAFRGQKRRKKVKSKKKSKKKKF